jgi:hypothetical protein
MSSTLPRHASIALVAALWLAGCGGGLIDERRERPQLREVFPPPGMEQPAPAGAREAPGAAAPPAAASAQVPDTTGAAAEGREAAGEAMTAMDAQPASPQVADDAPASTAALKAPSLEPEATLAQDTAAEPAAPAEIGTELELDREFRSAPAPTDDARPLQADVPDTAPPETSATEAGAAQPAPLHVLVSTRPALLVSIDGQPAYGLVEGTKLQRVLNTPAFLLKGLSGNYYLSVYDGFMRASKLSGPWTVLPEPPRVVQQAKARALVDGEADVLAGRPEAGSGQRPSLKQIVPRILVSTRPAVLVTIRGDPQYEPVEGTRLSRVVNTDARLFVHRPEDRTYLQVGERWYSAPSLEGPWEQAAAAALPPGLEEAVGRSD